MLKDLNWRPLDQRRIDSRLVMMYKVTYDLVAIPASDYLVRNTRTSRHIHPLAYRQILTLKDYYRFTFFPRTIIHWNTLPTNIQTLPTLSFFLFILPYALTDILGRLAQGLLVQDSKKGRIIVQRFKSIKVKDKSR